MRYLAVALLAALTTGCMGHLVGSPAPRKSNPSGKTAVTIDSPGFPLRTVNCQNPGEQPLPLYGVVDITSPGRCARLRQLGSEAFAPVPRNVACTEIYGGPGEARVVGVVNGHRVRADFNQANGCEIERWNRLRFLFAER